MKRIPCRVVRSVPFDRGGCVSRAGGCSVGSDDAGLGLVKTEFMFSSDSGNWTFGADGAKEPFVEIQAGIALDFLA